MILALLYAGLLAASPADAAGPTPEVAKAYDEARARSGRTPADQVKLALWCEAHGLTAERLNHLARAVLADPANATARGLMGLVAYDGRFQRPEAVAEKVGADASLAGTLAEYDDHRMKAAYTADAQWQLALWCQGRGLADQARAHLIAVTRLDPTRDGAWKRLGYRKHDGRWVTDASLAAEKAEAEAQKQADRRWKPFLEKHRAALLAREKRAEAEAALAEVTDPRAAASVARVFGAGRPGDHEWAVRLLGQIDGAAASRSLAALAVSSPSAEARRSAVETLRGRDTREFLASVIALLRKRVKYDVRPVGGPGSPGVLFVEGERFNVRRSYAPPAMPVIPTFAGEPVTYDAYGLPVISRYLGPSVDTRQVSHEATRVGPAPASAVAWVNHRGLRTDRFAVGPKETTTTTQTTRTPIDHWVQIPVGQLMAQYETAALVARQQQIDDIRAIDDHNTAVDRLNERATQVLRGVTGADRGEDPQSWTSWWVDQLGYAYKSPQSQPVPTFDQNIPLAYMPPGVVPQAANQVGQSTTTTSVSTAFTAGGVTHNCFKAGTPVRTLAGHRPIETIRVGDQVLTQDLRTGSLGYQPVLAVFHNRPGATLRIELDGESIVATTIHRFWKAGQGWVMARDLKTGDPLRTLGGTARVRAVEKDQVQPVFNLQVAEGGNFFVGSAGTLAHDNSIVEPVTTPFDATPTIATLAAGAK